MRRVLLVACHWPLAKQTRRPRRYAQATTRSKTTQHIIHDIALSLFDILGGPKFTLGGPTPPGRPVAEKLFTQSEYFTISNCVFNFNILALVVFELLGNPKFKLGGPVPPVRPVGDKFVYPRRVLYYV